MKKIFTLIAIVMLLGLALLCISCRQGTPETIESTNEETEQADSGITDTDATTETEASTETGKVDRLELSDINSPVIAEDKEEKATVVSTGTNEPASVVISFNEAEENYTFASFDFTGRHDSFNCGNCKYVEKNGTHAFYMHSDPSAHIGLAVDLKTPIEAAYVSAI